MSFLPVFGSRRSDVRGTGGMVATSQPLAARAGLRILEDGGHAADAAVAVAAMLSVVEPVCTGPGGDAFVLFRDAADGRVRALNGSGRSPAASSLPEIKRLMYRRMPLYTGHAVTVPGAVAAWADLLRSRGRMDLATVLAPAIRTAEEGYPVTDWIAASWAAQERKLLRPPGWESGDIWNGPVQESGHEFLISGRAPRAGEVMRLPTLARTLRAIAEGGPDAFYRGEIAAKIAAHVQRYGGWLTEKDLANHASTWDEPLSVDYRGVRLFECPPAGQGLAALLAAGLARGFDAKSASEGERHHLLIESMRLAFADALRWVGDPAFSDLPLEALLLEEYLAERRAKIDPGRAARFVEPGLDGPGGDTVYASIVDGEGNAVSLIQSLYMGTGTGLIPPGTGVSLQNRGAGFSLRAGHPNVLEPGKRPYHTIIPALATKEDELFACFGVMGGYMQPQGHLQVLSALVDRAASPQEALDAPRWQLVGSTPGYREPDPGGPILIEEGMAPDVVEHLESRGHRLRVVSGRERIVMGGGQAILRDPETGVLTGGSDPRKDGCALCY